MDSGDEKRNCSTLSNNPTNTSIFDIYAMDIEIIDDDTTMRFNENYDSLKDNKETLIKMKSQNKGINF